MVITSGSTANKVDNKTIPKTEMTWKMFRVQGSGADTTCFYASPSFCNLLPFFFLKAVCNRNSWHYVYTYQASRSKYLDISFHFNLPIWSGRQILLLLPPFSVNARVLLQLVSYKIKYKKTLSKNKLRMLLTVNYFLIDVKQIIYLSTLFAADPEVMTT